jgi:hypothetical protein
MLEALIFRKCWKGGEKISLANYMADYILKVKLKSNEG